MFRWPNNPPSKARCKSAQADDASLFQEGCALDAPPARLEQLQRGKFAALAHPREVRHHTASEEAQQGLNDKCPDD